MAEATVSERRTRSQAIADKDVFVIPDCSESPLKSARNALRKQITPASGNAAGESDEDELLLSPGKPQPSTIMNNPKRSASPPTHNGYHPPSSPSEGRELKRVKRSGRTWDGYESNEDGQRPPAGHSRTHSDSKIIVGHRSARKKSTSKAKKPVSVVSVSPPPTTFSPAPTSPTKARAQSVPVFLNANEILRIDFRNPPRSPKRRRSPSRSPSKDRETKLRIVSSGSRLFTIPDDGTMNANETDMPEASKVALNARPLLEASMDVEWSGKEVAISDTPGTPSDRKRIQSSSSSGEVIPASPLTGEMAPASPPTRQVNTSPPPAPIGEIIPASPPTYLNPTSRTINLKALATPAPHTLDKLIPMSPLTPLPETPMPTKLMTSTDTEERDATGWGIGPMKELVPPSELLKPQATIAPSISKSRLPRPSMAPPVVPSTAASRTSTMAPPALSMLKKPTATTKSTAPVATGNKTSGAAPKDAFAMMMKKPFENRAKLEVEKTKTGHKGMKVMPAPPIVFTPVGKSKDAIGAGSSSKPKQKLKERMRKREKRPANAPFTIALARDDDEEEWHEETVPESKVDGDANHVNIAGPSTDAEAEAEIVVSPMAVEATLVADKVVDNVPLRMDAGDVLLVQDVPKTGDDGLHEAAEAETVITPPLTSPQTDDTQLPYQADDTAAQALLASALADSSEVEPPVGETNAPVDTQAKESQVDQDGLSEATEPRPLSRAGKNKAPLGKKRQAPSIPLPVRVTRSASTKKNTEPEGSKIAGPSSKKLPSVRPPPAANKRVASGSLRKRAPPAESAGDVEGDAMAVDEVKDKEKPLPVGSPMRITPAKSSPRIARSEKDGGQTMIVDDDVLSVNSTPTKSGEPPSPSPTKIARSTFFAMKLAAGSAARTFSSSSLHTAPNSSLSTLSNALEKLRMPAPSRPNTSMGFNRDTLGDDDIVRPPARSKDDVTIGRTSIGLGSKAGGGVQRATTLGSSAFKPLSNAAASSSKTTSAAGTSTKLVQKPLSMFMANKANKGGASKPDASARRMGAFGGKPSIFGGGVRRTVSKKTTLPVVIGSPVKGGGERGDDASMQEAAEGEEGDDDAAEGDEDGGKIFNAIVNGGSATALLANLLAQGPEKSKEKEATHRPVHSSRRVSMLSRDLSHSLSALPPPPAVSGVRGAMGPPATPPMGSRVNASLGSGSGSSASGSPSLAGPTGAKRSSARIANAAPKVGSDGPSSAGKKAAVAAEPVNPAKKILKDCVIFVDVKSEDGDEAGSLFVEMLEGIGARVLTRVGQTCTHIVFKNGMPSTITRYKLLRDPKPLVVGIGWVVECIEQRTQVDETNFLIDLEHTNVAGHHKRRRSILPKLFAEEEASNDSVDGDRSMDGSVSSITMDDDLTPLERARRRKNKLAGA